MTQPAFVTAADAESRASWMPMVVIALAQLLLVFNLTTLKVSVDAIADGLGVPASSVKTAIVLHLLVVAGFIMLGARIAQRLGACRVFRATVAMMGAAMALMAVARNPSEMLVAQSIAGVASAALIPTSVVMISDNYRGSQQTRALGWLGGMQAMGIVPAFLLAGYLALSVEWRLTFGLLAVYAAALWFSSARLARTDASARIHIDAVGVLLAASAMLLLGIGADRLAYWGVWRARPGAPFDMLGLSPAPIAIGTGILLLYAFVVWTRRCRATGVMPLCAPEVMGTARERAALLSIFTIGAIGAGLTFLIPLYVEVVQGRTSLYTAVALVPFTSASFAAAIVIVRLDSRVGARRVARAAFLLVAGGLALLGATVRNDWSDSMVVLGLIVTGFGEGALATVLFKLLAVTVPRHLAGDVGSVCGSTNFLGSGVGTALAATLLVGVLGASVQTHAAANPLISADLRAQFDLDSVSFVSNEQLLRVLERTTATPEQIDEALRINTEARLVALKVSFWVLAGLALLAFIPAAGVSDTRGGERPDKPSRRSGSRPLLLLAALFALPLHAADPWDVDEDHVGIAMAEAHWTIDEVFPGTKVILEGRYSLRRRTGLPRNRACDCGEPLPAAERLRNTFGAQLQWGKGETGLEYGVLSFTLRASQRDYDLSAASGFHTLRDTLEWGVLHVGKDDPLGIDSYVDLSLARASRTWQYVMPGSPWRFSFGFNVSAGYAWVDSFDETYKDISNMTIGSWGKGTVSRGRWGMLYIEQRVVNGWTFSSPAAGGTVQREARARGGYTKPLRGCLDIEVFAEKRSFNFTDPQLPDLYTKSKRVGVAVSCTLTR